jgi:hypothetical protein
MADASPVRPEGPLKKEDPEVPGLGMFTSENTPLYTSPHMLQEYEYKRPQKNTAFDDYK